MKMFNHPSLLLALALGIRAYSRLNIQNDANLPSVQDDVAHKDLAPRDSTYDEAVKKGQAFWVQFSSGQYSAAITEGDVADSEFQDWKITSVSPVRGSTPDGTLTVVLENLVGSLRNQYYERRAAIELHGQQAVYKNLYGPKDGVIAALDTRNTGVSISMSNWSELSWRIWVETCESVSIDPKTLKYIIRHEIVNDQTLDIIEQIYHNTFPHTSFGDQIILLPSGRTLQGFQALLGSPNGRGVAWMLLNKRNVLGKTIAKITAERVEYPQYYPEAELWTWDMWFEIQEVAAAPSSATIM